MSNSNDVIPINYIDDEVYQVQDVTETLASILPADHILLVKLSEHDKQELVDLFELKQNSLVRFEEINTRIDNIVAGKITDEDIDNLKEIFISADDADDKYATRISLNSVINNQNSTNDTVNSVRISLSSVINKANDLQEQVDTINDKLEDLNVTLKSSNW